MKKIIFLLILAIPGSCKNDEQHDKLFNPENFDQLDLANISGFWDVNSDIDTSFDNEEFFQINPDFIDGIWLHNEDKSVKISVFTTRDIALIAMDARIKTMACAIKEGASDMIEGIWWYTDCMPSSVFVNQWNTIIEVSYYHASYETVEDTLYTTANEIARRIDFFSN